MRKRTNWKLGTVFLILLFVLFSIPASPDDVKAENNYPLRFDFGTSGSAVKEGYVSVTSETIYTEGVGYGFAENSQVISIDRETNDPLRSDFISVSESTFHVDLPIGDYAITLIAGDEAAETDVGLKVENIQKLPDTYISGGEYTEQTIEIALVDGQLNMEFTGANPKVNGIEIEKLPERSASEKSTIYIAGDSTVQTYNDYWRPEAGWGQMIPRFFTGDVIFNNQAIGGRSSKTFINEGRLDNILREIKPNDYFLIQFGHNDATISVPERYASVPDYKNYLKAYVLGARQRGATPILVTPMGRRVFDEETGKFNVSFPEYVQGMKEVAEELNVELVDLSARSVAYYDSISPEGSLSVFLYTDPGVYAAFPNGSMDNTHFQEYGAIQLARLVADEIKHLDIPLSQYAEEIEPPASIPDKPSDLAVSNISNTGAQITWNAVFGADIYRIYSKPNDDSDYQLVGTSTIPQLFLTNLNEETGYDVYVTAVNGRGESLPSDSTQFSTTTAMLKFDFGLAGSPVEAGFEEVNLDTVYTEERGYGIVDPAGMIGRDRNTGDNVTRDWLGYFNVGWNFNVDVPNGIYAVKVYVGDLSGSARTNLEIEGQDYGQVAASKNNYTSKVISQVSVEDGQMNFNFGGATGIVNGLEITPILSEPV